MNEYEIAYHFEQKVRNIFFETANDEGFISDANNWDTLIAMFLKNRVVSLNDTKVLDKFRPSFPIEYQTLLQTITQAFGDKEIKDFDSNITENKEQLENCRTYINLINVKCLRANELEQLATILYECKKKSDQTEKNLAEVVDKIKNLSEDSFAFVWDNLSKEHHSLAAIQLSHLKYIQDKASIEKEYIERKVRAVHYRK